MLRLIKKSVLASFCLTSGFLIGQVWDQPYRAVIKFVYQDAYANHVYNCDNAMREHFIAKSRLSGGIEKIDVEALQSTEIGLIDCHYYDKFRKKLISLGLDNNDLSSMGLRAIEAKKVDLSVLVKQHEIRY